MSDLQVYFEEIRALLGDPEGKRYSGEALSEALRQALRTYDGFFPKTEKLRVKVTGPGDVPSSVCVSGLPEWTISVLKARPLGKAEWETTYGTFREGGKCLLDLPKYAPKLRAGDDVELFVRRAHSIQGMEGAEERPTTVARGRGTLVCHGAAGFAMRIRSRSVLEVFGKRPEDAAALDLHGEALLREYECRLRELSLTECFE